MQLKQLKELIEHLKTLPTPETPEPTIFSIGSRGYYENPTSDVLAFFCDSDGAHGLGALMMEALFEALATANPESFSINFDDYATISEPAREVSTKDNKRIDLLLEGNDWVMVIENKIYHQQVNPFKTYQRHIKSCDEFKEKQPLYVILSPSGKAPEGWLGLSYPVLLNCIKAKLANAFVDQPLNKWLVLLREFILHLEGIMSKSNMPAETVSYVLDNLREIQQAQTLKDKTIKKFHLELLQELSAIFPDEDIEIKQSTWNKYPALRFSFRKWKSTSFAALYLDSRINESFCINYYVTDITTAELERKANEILKQNSTKQWKTGKNQTTLGYKTPFKEFDKSIAIEGLRDKLSLIDYFEMNVRGQC